MSFSAKRTRQALAPRKIGTKAEAVRAFIPFAQPDIGPDELKEVAEALGSGWITTGPKVQEFEAAFAEAVGARYAVALNSCTAALHLALEGIGLRPGDEVITTAYTFAATAEVVRYFDATLVLVDIRPDDFNIDPELVAAAVTPRTKAVIPVHIAGLAADLHPLHRLAAANDLAIIEDAAHAFPSRYADHPIGSSLNRNGESPVPHCVCFSFYATKTITTGEGGMITTDDRELAERFRVMSLHGIDRNAWKRAEARESWYYEIIAPGFKYNMTDIAAALGLSQLRRSQQMHERRQQIARAYESAFAGHPVLETPASGTHNEHSWYLYMLRLNLDRMHIDRDQFIARLLEKKVGTSVHFIPLHVHPYYRGNYSFSPESFPISLREFQREVSLPVYSKMSDRDVEQVIEAVLEVAHESEKRDASL